VLEIKRIIAYIQATMTGINKRAKQGKRDLYGEDAQSLYLAGKELAEIQQLLPVALVTLKRWHQEERWEEKRRQVPVSPRWLGEALKGILREKAGRLIIKGDLKAPELDELSKIVTLLDRLCSQGWDMRAAALEVMDRFIEFLRRWVKDPEELKQISYRVQEFFWQLEEDPDLRPLDQPSQRLNEGGRWKAVISRLGR
jgi:hypothetical protein